MNQKLFKLLQTIIPISFISVENLPELTSYSFEYKDGTQTMFVNICSEFSHATNNNIYIVYTLYIDGVVRATGTKPILPQKGAGAQTRNSIIAADLEFLMRLCSTKIIMQELEGQKTNMIKSIIGNSRTHS